VFKMQGQTNESREGDDVDGQNRECTAPGGEKTGASRPGRDGPASIRCGGGKERPSRSRLLGRREKEPYPSRENTLPLRKSNEKKVSATGGGAGVVRSGRGLSLRKQPPNRGGHGILRHRPEREGPSRENRLASNHLEPKAGRESY